MSYQVLMGHEAEKTIVKLDRTTAGRIRDQIRKIAANPFDPRISNQLKMTPEKRYSRVGDWRLVYEVNETQKVIDVSAVQHRSRVYKELKKCAGRPGGNPPGPVPPETGEVAPPQPF